MQTTHTALNIHSFYRWSIIDCWGTECRFQTFTVALHFLMTCLHADMHGGIHLLHHIIKLTLPLCEQGFQADHSWWSSSVGRRTQILAVHHVSKVEVLIPKKYELCLAIYSFKWENNTDILMKHAALYCCGLSLFGCLSPFYQNTE